MPQHESHNDMGIARDIMRAVFGTNTKCRLREERIKTDKMLAEAERKVERLDAALDSRPARNLDEAIEQVSQRRVGRH